MTKNKLDLFNKSVDTKLSDAISIAPLLQADTNAEINAKGLALLTVNGILSLNNADNTQKHIAAKSASDVLLAQEVFYDDAMKAAAAKVMEIYPKNPDKWTALGFSNGSAAVAAVIPIQISGLSVTHSEIATENDLHWNVIKGSKFYKIQECEAADPSVVANWKPATPDFALKSKITVTDVNPLVQNNPDRTVAPKSMKEMKKKSMKKVNFIR